jgi:hypothetical protein
MRLKLIFLLSKSNLFLNWKIILTFGLPHLILSYPLDTAFITIIFTLNVLLLDLFSRSIKKEILGIDAQSTLVIIYFLTSIQKFQSDLFEMN